MEIKGFFNPLVEVFNQKTTKIIQLSLKIILRSMVDHLPLKNYEIMLLKI